MTIRQIARLCSVGEQTVRDWIRAGTAAVSPDPAIVSASIKLSAAGHGKAATLTLAETLAIVRAGGNATLADLLAENARPKAPPKLPSGAQLHELNVAVKAGTLTRYHVQALLGLGDVRRPIDATPPVPAREAIGLLAKIRQDLESREQPRLPGIEGGTW